MQNRRSQLADMLSRAEGQQQQVHYHPLNYFSSKDNLKFFQIVTNIII